MSVTGTVFTFTVATDGLSVSYGYPDYLFQFSDLQVTYTDSGGVAHPLTMISDYTLAGTPDAFGAYPAGVTLTTLNTGAFGSPLPAGGTLFFTRYTARTQNIQYIDGDSFPADRTEHALDKLTLMIQELSWIFQGFAVVPPTLPGAVGQVFLNATPIPGGMWGWVMTTQGWREFANISLL